MSHFAKLILCLCGTIGSFSQAPLAAAESNPAPSPTSREHWAFYKPLRPCAPDVQNQTWPRNPIDAFILARLEKEALSPAPEAGRATLIRRLSYDLTGLPPTPEEVQAFAADSSANAYESLVERLLASPRCGERWARHWLDVVRFAESNGFETNLERKNAWPYRDYVIRAFNEDKPYDQFIVEQLAGDVVGAPEATGFMVGGPWDAVKSPDINLTAQQRMDELHDMVSTTGSTFLGLTVGCARCHDHKFDPVSQRDYYSLQAVFAGVQHGERTWHTADYDQRIAQAEVLRKRISEIDGSLAQFEPLAHPAFDPAQVQKIEVGNRPDLGPRAAGRPALRPPVHPRLNVERFAPVKARFVRFTIRATTSLEPCLDELEVYTASDSPRNIALSSAGTKATASGTYPNSELHTLAHLNDGRLGNSRSWISNEPGRGWVQLEFAEPALISTIVWGRDREEKFSDRLATAYEIAVADNAHDWKTVANSQDRQPYVPDAKPKPAYAFEGLAPAETQRLNQLLAEKKQLDQKIKNLTTFPVVYGGKFEKPGPTHRLYRGEALQKREIVTPGAIQGLGSRLDLPAETPEQERRLALARWMIDPENPLTARVLVNRLWHYHFGRGLLDTPSDFGRNGARPTHPELLDWLATEFMAQGWSIKAIHRLIVLSSTYRQSSQFDAKAAAADADDRGLWRFPSRRLEAEALRDTILSVSGNLDLRMGGPGFDLFEPNGNYVKVYNPKKEFGPAEWRRMVYQSKPRMRLDDTFGAFDCPDAGQIAPKRTTSTTPLQSLNLLNSPFAIAQANIFASRLEKETGADPRAQVRRAFWLAFGREPSPPEDEASRKIIEQHGLGVFCRALFNANEFVYVF